MWAESQQPHASNRVAAQPLCGHFRDLPLSLTGRVLPVMTRHLSIAQRLARFGHEGSFDSENTIGNNRWPFAAEATQGVT